MSRLISFLCRCIFGCPSEKRTSEVRYMVDASLLKSLPSLDSKKKKQAVLIFVNTFLALKDVHNRIPHPYFSSADNCTTYNDPDPSPGIAFFKLIAITDRLSLFLASGGARESSLHFLDHLDAQLRYTVTPRTFSQIVSL